MRLITIISSFSLVSAYFEADCKGLGDSCDSKQFHAVEWPVMRFFACKKTKLMLLEKTT